MWDYSEKVMDHYRNPRNVGTIDNADAVGIAGSLTCGDQLKIYLKIKDNIVTDAKFQTFGCGSAVASSSMLTEMIIGKTIDEVKKITNKDSSTEDKNKAYEEIKNINNNVGSICIYQGSVGFGFPLKTNFPSLDCCNTSFANSSLMTSLGI